MNWVDGVIIGIFLVSCAIGLYRGFAREALSLLVWIAAVLIAKIFNPELAAILSRFIGTPALATVTAFTVLFILTLLVGAILGLIVSALIKTTGLTTSDRALGFVFGSARAFIVVMVLLMVLPAFLAIDKTNQWQQATLVPHFLEYKDWVWMAYESIVNLFSNKKFIEV
jgi:membrane protein required for colicin V production